MASAGRILIMPKGNYNANTTYEMLDMVFHNGTSWLAKTTIVGIEPSEANGEHWHKVINLEDVLSNYLHLDGGNMRGQLGLGNGKGTVAATEYATYLTAYENESNYRSVKVVNSSTEDDVNHLAQVVNCTNGQVTEYYLFGEHNKDLLKPFIEQVIEEYLAKN